MSGLKHHFFVKPKPPYPDPVSKPLRPLTVAEAEVVQENRALVHQMGRDAVDFVGEMHKAGLIAGWRSVGSVVLFEEGKQHGNA